MVKFILKLESLCIFLSSLFVYHYLGGSWTLFVLLFFTPDLSILVYIFNKKIGAIFYNLFHMYLWFFLLVIIGFIIKNNLIISFGVIYASHISFDRMIGYGLKYPDSFKNTHLSKI